MPRKRKFVCVVCGEDGIGTHSRQVTHRGRCKSLRIAELRKMRVIKVPPAFVPASFDDAMARGRMFWTAGYFGDEYPHGGFAVSPADIASYNLGMRHKREFANA